MTGSRNVWLGLLVAAGLAWSGSSQAAAGKGISGPEVVSLLQEAGYRAKLSTDKDGDPKIETRMSGVNVFVTFYDCKQGRCGSLQFEVGLDLDEGSSLATVNAFNKEYRYARASLDDEMDPFLAFDFEVLHTDHTDHIVSQLDLWEDLLGEFLDATGFNGRGQDDTDA